MYLVFGPCWRCETVFTHLVHDPMQHPCDDLLICRECALDRRQVLAAYVYAGRNLAVTRPLGD